MRSEVQTADIKQIPESPTMKTAVEWQSNGINPVEFPQAYIYHYHQLYHTAKRGQPIRIINHPRDPGEQESVPNPVTHSDLPLESSSFQ